MLSIKLGEDFSKTYSDNRRNLWSPQYFWKLWAYFPSWNMSWNQLVFLWFDGKRLIEIHMDHIHLSLSKIWRAWSFRLGKEQMINNSHYLSSWKKKTRNKMYLRIQKMRETETQKIKLRKHKKVKKMIIQFNGFIVCEVPHGIGMSKKPKEHHKAEHLMMKII